MDCDYLKFCAFEESAGAVNAENITRYEEAAALYTGEYLSGWEFYWTLGRRIRLEEKFIGLLLEIARYCRNSGSFQKAVNG